MNPLATVLQCPTAPFHEHHVAQQVGDLARHVGLPMVRDHHGNLIVTYDGRGSGDDFNGRISGAQAPNAAAWSSDHPLALVASMDAPGLEIIAVAGNTAEAVWHGAGEPDRIRSAPLIVHTRHGAQPARVRSLTTRPVNGKLRADRLLLTVSGQVRMGDFGTSVVPGVRRAGPWVITASETILSGVAILLEVLGRLARAQPAVRIQAVFTRCAHVGFAGAVGLLQSGMLPREQPVVCVSGLPSGPSTGDPSRVALDARRDFGQPVLVVGDGSLLSDAGLSAYVAQTALEIPHNLAIEKRLLTEADTQTAVFAAFGHPACGLGLPLFPPPDALPLTPTDRFYLEDYQSLVSLLEGMCHGWRATSSLQAAAKRHSVRLATAAADPLSRLR